VQEATRERVLTWGVANLRDLPWRRTRDPWAILVSEVMLQQTQVERVIPKWFAFLHAYPTPSACAAVPLGDVLRRWQGLGYPRRARNLHAAALRIVDLGRFPAQFDTLLTLPGVGQYTARAIITFAFEGPAAVVDTNIARIYARVSGVRLTGAVVQRLADDALPAADGAGDDSWAWNQTLMDVGALLCRPMNPRCDECPISPECSWHGCGDDPAIASAAVSVRQSPFQGSDRQCRGRMLAALGRGPVARDDVAAAMGVPAQPERAERLITSLVDEGLAVGADGGYRLP